MKQRLLVSVVVLAFFLPMGLPVFGQVAEPVSLSGQTTPREAAALQEEVYYVDWNITAIGESDVEAYGTRTVTHQVIQIGGSAAVHKPAQGFLNTIPFQLTIRDDWYQVETTACYEDHSRWSITDPGRYNGGPDPFWVFPTTFWPQQRDDGSWYMDNPLSDLNFAINGQLSRTFNYRNDSKRIDFCGNNDSSDSITWEMMNYSSVLFPMRDMPLEGDPSGTTFSLSKSYTVTSVDVLLHVNFNATVRTGSCKSISAPIDISSPYITSLELNLETTDTEPDSTSYLLAKVTCQGVPVKNALVEVTMRAAEGTGGHHHAGSKRPRGFIEGIEITEETYSVANNTGDDGTVFFVLEPGSDLTNKTRGIAGWYIVEAKVVKPGFTAAPEERTGFHASLPLLPLPGNPNYVFNRVFAFHPDPYWGKPETVQRIQQAAATWKTWQESHNQVLLAAGKSEWPVYPLWIYAVSLELGGMFDAYAEAPQNEWRTPFDRHRTGTDVMLTPYYTSGQPAGSYAWYERKLRKLGKLYGTWFSESGNPYHLRINPALTGLSMDSSSSPGASPSVTPDLATVAVLSDPRGRFVAGAGQTVTYTVGVENIIWGTQANNVVLSATLPAELNFLSADPPPDYQPDAQTLIWVIGSLPAEAVPRTFDVAAQISPSVAAGTILTVSTMATTSSGDADLTNNSFEAWGLTVQPAGPDLVIYSDLDGTALTIGEPVSFTIRLSNDGNSPAPDSWLELSAPSGITITATDPSASAILGGVHWDAGALDPGSGQTFTTTLRVDPGLLDLSALLPGVNPVYSLPFSMTAGSTSNDIDPASNQVQVDQRAVLPGPDLVVLPLAEGTPGPGLIQAGQEYTYTLRYANFGNKDASAVSATLQLWPGLTLQGAQPAPDDNQLDPLTGVRTLTWHLGELAVGEDGAVEVRLQVDHVPEAGSIVLARVSSNSLDLNPSNNVDIEIRNATSGAQAGKYRIFLPIILRPE